MKNVKKIRQLTMRLKMQWKILIGVLVSGVACGGVLIFANAHIINWWESNGLKKEK